MSGVSGSSALPLYSREILALAMQLSKWPLEGHFDGQAECRSQICGSTIKAGVMLDDAGLITAVGMAAQSCALGQASAVLLCQSAAGKSATDVIQARHSLQAFLRSENGVVEDVAADSLGSWPRLDLLAPARPYPARHSAILLSYDAIIAAMNAAGEHR